jgi:hypothetical protein
MSQKVQLTIQAATINADLEIGSVGKMELALKPTQSQAKSKKKSICRLCSNPLNN